MVTVFPSISVQSNWDETSSSGRFWVSCRRPGRETIEGKLRKSSGAKTTDDFFIVKDYSSSNSITVHCPEAAVTTTFVRPRRVIPLHDKKVLCGDVTDGGLGVCASEQGQLWVWDIETGETRRRLEGHVGDVYSCKFFPSGVVVLSGGADRQLKIWSAVDGSCPRTLIAHSRGITDTAIIDKGRNILSVSSDGTARLWDCGSGTNLATMDKAGCPINSCALRHSDLVPCVNPPAEPECGTAGKMLLLACEDGTLQVLDLAARTTVGSCPLNEGPASSCLFLNESQALVGTDNGVIATVDLRNTRSAVNKISFGKSAVNCLLQLRDGQCIAGLRDGSCRVWHCGSKKLEFSELTGPEFDEITSVRTASGNVYTTCRDGCVRVYRCSEIP